MFFPIPLEFKYAGAKSRFPVANRGVDPHQRAGLPVWLGLAGGTGHGPD